MRRAAQITSTPSEYADIVTGEQLRAQRELHELLARARARGDEWIRWIDAGCPPLTADEYAATQPRNFRRRRKQGRAA